MAWRWEPPVEPALEPTQVGAGGAVADVAVGPDQVVGGPPHAQPGQGHPVGVVQRARAGLAGQVVDGQQARQPVQGQVEVGHVVQ